jgi:hypothetical protein
MHSSAHGQDKRAAGGGKESPRERTSVREVVRAAKTLRETEFFSERSATTVPSPVGQRGIRCTR